MPFAPLAAYPPAQWDIYAAQCADSGALAHVHASCFVKGWSAEDICSLIDDGVTRLFASGERISPAGFVIVRSVAGEAEILTLAVDPTCRRRGIGHALMAQSIAWARQSGASEMFLEVAVDNHAARALYEALGFAAAGRRENYYDDADGACLAGKSALVLRLDMAG